MAQALTLPVEHVSDTAFMVAAYRLMESQRSDARFHDPFAADLLGVRAERYLAEPKQAALGSWMMTVRTCMIDRWLREQVQAGVRLIVNLAAGLDTRPYRLHGMSPDLSWLEVDFAPLLAHKTRVMDKHKPLYPVERMVADLTKTEDLARLSAAIAASGKNTLVLTEGLLLYLEEAAVDQIALTLRLTPQVTTWLSECSTPRFLAWAMGFWQEEQGQGKVSFSFAPDDPPAYFASHGWQLAKFRSFADESRDLGRTPPTKNQTVDEVYSQLAGAGFGLFVKQAKTLS